MGKTAASSFKEDIGIIRRCPLRIRITEINSLADSIVPSHLVIGKNKERACYRILRITDRQVSTIACKNSFCMLLLRRNFSGVRSLF